MKIYDIAVIGGGSGGVMATLRSVLNNDETILFPGSPKHNKKSRALWVSKVENMPGHLQYKKGIVEPNRESLTWLTTSKMSNKFHWMKNRGIEFIEKNNDVFRLVDNKGEEYFAKYVILATGVMDVQPVIGDSIAPILPFANVQLAEYCLRCDGHHIIGKDSGVIGHGDGAAWVAIMLFERYSPPSMTIYLNGEDEQFKDRSRELIKKYGVKVVKDKIKSIQGDPKAGLLEGMFMEDDSFYKVENIFVSLGMIVYNELALQLNAKVDDRGFVVGDKWGHTSVENLFVVGDLKADIKNQIYTAWDSAVDSADYINNLIRKEKRKLL